jgi:hypothetical protein
MANMKASKAMKGSNLNRHGINYSAFKQDSTRMMDYGKVPTVGVKPAVAAPKSSSMKPASSDFKKGYKAPHEIHAVGVKGGAEKTMSTMMASVNQASKLHDSSKPSAPKAGGMNKNFGPKDFMSKVVKGHMGGSRKSGGIMPGPKLQTKSTKSSF